MSAPASYRTYDVMIPVPIGQFLAMLTAFACEGTRPGLQFSDHQLLWHRCSANVGLKSNTPRATDFIYW